VYAVRGKTPCSQVGKEMRLSVTWSSYMQAYFAIAEGLKQNATLKAALGKAPEELLSNIDPRMTKAHCTLKRKLEEFDAGDPRIPDSGSLAGSACQHSVLRSSSGAEAAR
jgi:hypothetical protein